MDDAAQGQPTAPATSERTRAAPRLIDDPPPLRSNQIADTPYVPKWKFLGIFDGPSVAAITSLATGDVNFGTSVFADENICASTIGHELMHTPMGGSSSECTAYTWEVNHINCTGLQPAGVTELEQKKAERCR